ncbi:hypothetical protein K440DRAFT_642253 [Wilcoxina mikolae CBS 423.85]|nr:hypothetical protein K440DRAFT_642253 [Wilcoxina mikolae CBS 423.85]
MAAASLPDLPYDSTVQYVRFSTYQLAFGLGNMANPHAPTSASDLELASIEAPKDQLRLLQGLPPPVSPNTEAASASTSPTILLDWDIDFDISIESMREFANKIGFLPFREKKNRVFNKQPQTLSCVSELVAESSNLRKFQEAQQIAAEFVEEKKKTLGEEHNDTLAGMYLLASTYGDQDRWKEAGKLAGKQGRWKEAEELERRIFDLGVKKFGVHHGFTLINKDHLAEILRGQGRWKEAEEMDRETLEVRIRVARREHPHTVISMRNLAFTLTAQGRLMEAELMEVQIR